MLRIVNPIEYGDLDPEIRLRLDRYVRRLTTVKKQQWAVDQVYKPTKWFRARLKSVEGSTLVVWFRPKKRCWTVVDSSFGSGIYQRPRRLDWLDKALRVQQLLKVSEARRVGNE